MLFVLVLVCSVAVTDVFSTLVCHVPYKSDFLPFSCILQDFSERVNAGDYKLGEKKEFTKCYTLFLKKAGEVTVKKNCMPPDSNCEKEKEKWVAEYSNVTCVECEGDNCNSASKTSIFGLFGVVLASLLYMF